MDSLMEGNLVEDEAEAEAEASEKSEDDDETGPLIVPKPRTKSVLWNYFCIESESDG